jgi:hypothetical protein
VEEQGRDLRSFADQAVEVIRGALRAALGASADLPPDPRLAEIPAAGLAVAARRLAAIDPTSAGPGGIRFALELALLAPLPAAAGAAPQPVDVTRVQAARPASLLPGAGAAAAETGPKRSARGPSTEPAAAVGAPPAPPIEPPPPASSGEPAAPPARKLAGRGTTLSPTTTAAGEPAPAPAGVSGPGGASLSLDEIRGRWGEIVATLSRHPPTKPLIEACRPIAVDGNLVTLGFPESQQFLRDVADRRRPNLEEALAGVLGRPVAVRCVATNLELGPAAADDADAAAVLLAAREVWGDDILAVPEVD